MTPGPPRRTDRSRSGRPFDVAFGLAVDLSCADGLEPAIDVDLFDNPRSAAVDDTIGVARTAPEGLAPVLPDIGSSSVWTALVAGLAARAASGSWSPLVDRSASDRWFPPPGASGYGCGI